MPPAMVSSVHSISQKEKVVFIYKCLYGPPIKKNGCIALRYIIGGL